MNLPIKIGGYVGIVWGTYEGFKFGREETLSVHVLCTTSGIICGYVWGSMVWLVWPITIVVAISRFVDCRK